MGRILLEGMKFRVNIGTTIQERNQGNDITVDISYNCDTLTSGLSDNLKDAVDYSLIYDVIKKETFKPCNLIENLAYRMLHSVKIQFPEISDITLKLYKYYPAVDGELEKSGIILQG